MSSAMLGDALGGRICEALGIDPLNVRAIDISIAPGCIATALIEHYLDAPAADGIVTAITEYRLVPAEETTP